MSHVKKVDLTGNTLAIRANLEGRRIGDRANVATKTTPLKPLGFCDASMIANGPEKDSATTIKSSSGTASSTHLRRLSYRYMSVGYRIRETAFSRASTASTCVRRSPVPSNPGRIHIFMSHYYRSETGAASLIASMLLTEIASSPITETHEKALKRRFRLRSFTGIANHDKPLPRT